MVARMPLSSTADQMPVGPTQVRLPDPSQTTFDTPERIDAYLRDLNQSIVGALTQRPAVTHPRPELLLFAPNGNTYALVVDNAGALTAVLRNQVSA